MSDKHWKYWLLFTLPGCLLWSCEHKGTSHHIDAVLWTAVWSPDGHTIAMGGTHDSLRLFSGDTYKLISNRPVPGTITKLKWHPTEDLLAITTQISGQKPGFLNLNTGEMNFLNGTSETGSRAIGWNHDATLLAVGDLDAKLHIFSVQGELLQTVDTEQKGITGLSWHPRKNLIVAVGEYISTYDYETDSLSSIISRPEEVLMLSVAWHPSGNFFVTGDYGDNQKPYPPLLQFWNEEGEKTHSINMSLKEYRNIRWSHDGRFLVTASDALRIWTSEGELLHTGSSDDLLWGVDWSPDDRHIVTTDIGGRAFVWTKEAKKVRELVY